MNGVQPLRVGVIGAGYQGREHLAAVEHLVTEGRLALAGICDTNAQMAQAYADRLQTRWSTNFKKLILEEEPELVILSVPNHAYEEMIRFSLSQRINVLKEKPLALTYGQGKAYTRLAHENKVLFVTSQQRYYNAFADVRQWLAHLGEILLFDYTFILRDGGEKRSQWYWEREAGGGCWYGLGWHACFLIAWYLGLPDQMRVRNINSKRHDGSYQTDDTTLLECFYNNGPIARGFVSVVGAEKREQLYIQGTKGAIQVDRAGATLFDAKGVVMQKMDTGSQNPYVRQLEGIAAAIRSHSQRNIIDTDLSLQTMLMIKKGFDSSRRGGRSVRL